MHKIIPQSLVGRSLFGSSLVNMIPKDHPKKIILDKLPWDELTAIAKKAYASHMWKGKPNARIMIGLFVWQSISGDKTYREVADDFTFNSLCAYACGFTEVGLRTIDHTTLIKFEEHLGADNILAIKDIIEKMAVDNQPPNSKGRHSGDTTVFESNITFPTDSKIMESVRLFLVNDIIKPYQTEVNQEHRTYTMVARKEFLDFAKKRITSKEQVRKITKKQLQHLKRNIAQAEMVISALDEKRAGGLSGLCGRTDQKAFKKLKTKLETAKLIYAQQLKHYLNPKEQIVDRIVNFHRPSVRPIFRGKAQKKTEFGVKAFVSIMGRALILSKTSYDNFYDGHGFKEAIIDMNSKGYKVREVIGDKGNGGICGFLKENNITDGIEKRGKRIKEPPIPKKRFARARNMMEGGFGLIKNVFIKGGLRAKTDAGDERKIMKALIGYNLRYAL